MLPLAVQGHCARVWNGRDHMHRVACASDMTRLLPVLAAHSHTMTTSGARPSDCRAAKLLRKYMAGVASNRFWLRPRLLTAISRVFYARKSNMVS